MENLNLNDYFAKVNKELAAQINGLANKQIEMLKSTLDKHIAQIKESIESQIKKAMAERIVVLVKNGVISAKDGKEVAKTYQISNFMIKKPTVRRAAPAGGCASGPARAC